MHFANWVKHSIQREVGQEDAMVVGDNAFCLCLFPRPHRVCHCGGLLQSRTECSAFGQVPLKTLLDWKIPWNSEVLLGYFLILHCPFGWSGIWCSVFMKWDTCTHFFSFYRRNYYAGNWASFTFNGLLSWIEEYKVIILAFSLKYKFMRIWCPCYM